MRYGFAQRLREKFRSSFTLRLDRARARGILKLTGRFEYLRDDDNWSAFKKQLASKNWVAHIQPPPTSQSLAHHVINYLTRYVTGGPISNRRIVSGDSRSVTFLAREGARAGGERTQVPIVPWWYKEARNEDDQRFWDGAMGAGFNDWYLETLTESAKEPEPSESPPKQAWLTGFETIRMASEYPLNSF